MSVRKNTAYAIATWLGSGNSPKAPGTMGSAAALPLFWLLRRSHPAVYWSTTLGISVAGIWASQVVAEDRGDKDPQLVVVDEVAGVLIAMGLARGGSTARQAAAWLLFRALDISKPGPIRKAEKMRPAGLGIMMDDLVAGALAGLACRVLR